LWGSGSPESCYGIPLALATIEMHGISVAVLVPSSRLWRHGYAGQFPIAPHRGRIGHGALGGLPSSAGIRAPRRLVRRSYSLRASLRARDPGTRADRS